jgi:hypothetical protein
LQNFRKGASNVYFPESRGEREKQTGADIKQQLPDIILAARPHSSINLGCSAATGLPCQCPVPVPARASLAAPAYSP